MGGPQSDKKSRGHGGSKRKYIQTFGGDRNVAMPYGKQGILVTLLIPNISRAGREAVNVFTEAWEELIAAGVKQGPFVAPVLPTTVRETDAQPNADATDGEIEAPQQDSADGQPAAKTARHDNGKASLSTDNEISLEK